MIAQHSPTPRRWHALFILLTIVLGALTFTQAADRSPASPTEKPNEPTAPSASGQEDRARKIKMLRQQLEEYDARIRDRQNRLDALGQELGISGHADHETLTDTLRSVTQKRIEIKSQLDEETHLLEQMQKLPRAKLKSALTTALPDAQLSSLLTNQAEAEQKLALIVTERSPEHPDVKSLRSLLAKIDQQVDDRVEGILLGLKARQEAMRNTLENLALYSEQLKARELKATIESRPFRDLQRDLESLEKVRNQLASRLAQEQIDAALR